MSKVLIDRELLERAVYGLELAYETDTPTVRDICAVLAAPSGTHAMPVKAYYHEAPNEYGGFNKSVGLEVRKEFNDAPLVLEADALARIACLEGEIAKRDARIAEMQERFDSSAHRTSLIGRLEIENDQLRAELAATKAQEPVSFQYQARTGEWNDFVSARHYADTLADGTWPIRALYAAPVSEAKAQGVVMPERWNVPRPMWKDARQPYGNPLNHADIEAAEKFNLALDEVARLNAAPAAPAADAGLVEALEKIAAYAPCSGIKDPGFTKMHMGILARAALAASRAKGVV